MKAKESESFISKNTNTRIIGKNWEQVAGSFLEEKGLKILEYNFKLKVGEIDIIAFDGTYLIFLEVKYRKSYAYGLPSQAVNKNKQKKIRKTASIYLLKNSFRDPPLCRFDVISICTENGLEIEWIKDAF